MRLFVVIVLPYLLACGGSTGTPDGALADAAFEFDASIDECTPTSHATQGFQADLTLQRYRIVATSADGHRIVVLTSHFGPSSGDPFANVYGYEQGSGTLLFHVSKLMLGGGTSEQALQATEEEALAEAAASLEEHGLTLLTEAATPVSWCVRDSRIMVQDEGSFTWSTTSAECGGGASVVTWSACPDGGSVDRCVSASTECLHGLEDVRLVDIFRFQNVMWVVTEWKVQAIDPLYLTLRMTAGRELAP